MNNELESKNITISAVEIVTWGLKIKDEKGLVFNIPELVKTGENAGNKTAAFIALSNLPQNGMNLNKCFKFVTVDNNQGGKSRYVRVVTEPVEGLVEPQYIPNAQSTTNTPKTSPQGNSGQIKADIDWDAVNFGKCKHQFLIELFKGHIAGTNKDTDKGNEELAEKWAKMSMRILKKEEVNIEELGKDVTEQFPPDDDIKVENIPF